MSEAYFYLEELNHKETLLPEGTESLAVGLKRTPCILNIREAKGWCGFWYDLAFETDGYRLGHNLFLMENEGEDLRAEDFRYQTTKFLLEYECIPITTESSEKLSHDLKRLFLERDELKSKWKYQTQVYDEKVEDVLRLEKDKVELNEAIEELRQEVSFWREKYHEMEGSLSWKMTAPVRSMNASVKKLKENSPIRKEKTAFLQSLSERVKNAEKEALRFSLLIDVSELPDAELFPLIYRLREQTFCNFELILAGGAKLAGWIADKDPDIRVITKYDIAGFAEAATGDYLAVFHPKDRLEKETLSECVKKLLETGADFLYTDSDAFGSGAPKEARFFKPDFSPDFLRSCNYIRGFFTARKELFQKIGDGEREYGGQGCYGLILSLTELAEKGKGIAHLPEILYHENLEERPGVILEAENDASLRALGEHLERVGLPGIPETVDKKKGYYHIHYELLDQPLISILIPNKDHAEDLRRCIDSILRLSTYRNIEIIVAENNSAKKETFDFYKELENGYSERFSRIVTEDGGRTLMDTEAEQIPIRVVRWQEGFNFSAINNFAVPETKGTYLLLLNNDIEVITPNWIEEMLMYAERSDVGAVGAKLYYMDNTVQHAGVIIGLGGVAAHSHLNFSKEAEGYMGRLRVVQNLSAVTAACLLMRKSVYEEIGGMNPNYEVAFNDADFCMRIRAKGYLIVFTPFAELHHDESKSRGTEDTPEKAERFESEVQRFKAEWPEILKNGDPYYNPHLTTDREDFAIKE